MALVTNFQIGRNGRLGNQLFQAAAVIGFGESLIAGYGMPEWWGAQACFKNRVGLPIATSVINELFTDDGRVNPNFGWRVFDVREVGLGWSPFTPSAVDILDNNCLFLLNGYFQCYGYFQHVEHVIRKAFEPIDHISEYIQDQYKFVSGEEYTSIHIRRGDYVTLSQSHPDNPHPPLPLDYYHNAMEEIGTKKILVFSDDIAWCQQNFKDKKYHFVQERNHLPQESDQSNPQFISQSDRHLIEDYTEMVLMSQCRNNIIANSSFSWWGAWLNKNIDKQVIAPRQWFSDQYADPLGGVNHFLKFAIPPKWKIL